jgi:hypothetical protein
MKAQIAVATVSGKSYYIIVNELKKKEIPFLSLTPDQPIPIETKVVITTESEKEKIHHDRILILEEDTDPEQLINEACQVVRGKEHFERIVVGIDPGQVFGLAVLADGKVIQTANCFSIEETAEKVKNILKNFADKPISSTTVKIGDGVPKCRETLLQNLNDQLPSNIVLETVSEAGTNRYMHENKHRRGLRDIVSAIRIAGRNGHVHARRTTSESIS